MPVTSIQEWRAKHGPQEVELPSGCVAQLRRVHILELARSGEIPATLVTKIEEASSRGELDATKLLAGEKDLAQYLDLIDKVVMKAFVVPRLGIEATDEQLALHEVDFTDRLFVFRWCNRGAEQLKPFRPEPEADVEPAPDGEDVRDETE